MKKKIRYAVVGLGHIAQTAVLPAFKHAENSELAALVTGNPEKDRELSKRYKVKAYTYDDLESALERVFFLRPGAMLVFPDGVTLVNRLRIAQFAKNHGLPTMFGWREYCDAGGLVSYGASQRATYRHLASYADRLLHGESPATLPIERPTSFELVINLKTAGLLGLKVPTALLVRANDLIE